MLTCYNAFGRMSLGFVDEHIYSIVRQKKTVGNTAEVWLRSGATLLHLTQGVNFSLNLYNARIRRSCGVKYAAWCQKA